jgi:hypothetical protein
MLLLILIIIFFVFNFVSNNLYTQVSNIVKECLKNEKIQNQNLVNLCNYDSTNLSNNFYNCFTGKIDNLSKENENKNMLKKILDNLRTLPSGQINLLKSLTGVNKIEKVKDFVCNMIKNQEIIQE